MSLYSSIQVQTHYWRQDIANQCDVVKVGTVTGYFSTTSGFVVAVMVKIQVMLNYVVLVSTVRSFYRCPDRRSCHLIYRRMQACCAIKLQFSGT